MLNLTTAVRFDGRIQSGRTVPCRLICENDEGMEVEVVATGLKANSSKSFGAIDNYAQFIKPAIRPKYV
ncbi:MAG: hypothetical protein HY848_05345 [Betaproteobacteria bacterium]|nr:hypothetical protein [Betaproteobacteria bacterium]